MDAAPATRKPATIGRILIFLPPFATADNVKISIQLFDCKYLYRLSIPTVNWLNFVAVDALNWQVLAVAASPPNRRAQPQGAQCARASGSPSIEVPDSDCGICRLLRSTNRRSARPRRHSRGRPASAPVS